MPLKVAPAANDVAVGLVMMHVCDLRCFIPTGLSNLLYRKRSPFELALVLCEFDLELFKHHRSSQ